MSSGAPLNWTPPASGSKNWDSGSSSSIDSVIFAINSLLATHATQLTALQAGGATGPQGAAGPTPLIFAGAWSPSVNYVAGTTTVPGNWVTFNGGSYYAIANNINRQPDINTNTWVPMALPGAAGPAGPTGATGPQGAGSGSSVSFPITIPEGGTGAITAPAALAALGAAANGVNNDITRLIALTADTTISGTHGAIQISSPSGEGQALLFNNGTGGISGGFTTAGNAYFSSLSMTGGLLCGSVLSSGGVTSDQYNSATGTQMIFSAKTHHGLGIAVASAAPVVATGELGIGAGTSTTCSAGSISLPSLCEGLLVWNVNGVTIKIPFWGV